MDCLAGNEKHSSTAGQLALQHQKNCLLKMALPLLCVLREQHWDPLVKTVGFLTKRRNRLH